MQLIPLTTNSLAYIDGGSASMFFQALIGGALALTYLVGTKFGLLKEKVRAVVRRSHSQPR